MRNIAVLLMVFLWGCTPALKLYYGYHEPTPEDPGSLKNYLKRKKINSDNILVFSDSLSFYKRLKKVKDFPEIRFFNKEGIQIYYKEVGALCSGPAYDFTKSLCSISDFKMNSSANVTSEISQLLTFENTPVVISKEDPYDYYVFIYWARYLGRLNKDHVKVWENNLKELTGCKVKVYKVDMDWQKKWDVK